MSKFEELVYAFGVVVVEKSTVQCKNLIKTKTKTGFVYLSEWEHPTYDIGVRHIRHIHDVGCCP